MTPDLAAAIARAEQAGEGHIVPAIRAQAAGLINLGLAYRGWPFSMRPLKVGRRPILVILGDDDASPTGPAGWHDAERLVRWARFIALHAAGAEPQHYAAAVLATQTHRRLLLIETSTAQLEAWQDFIGRVQPRVLGLVIAPPPGVRHPMAGAPAGVARH